MAAAIQPGGTIDPRGTWPEPERVTGVGFLSPFAHAAGVGQSPSPATYTDVVLHATIRQGTAFRSAGDNNHLQCGGRRGDLPPGDCTESLGIQANNSTSGNGDLQKGGAVLEIEMTTSGTRLSLVTVPITLALQ